MNVYLYQNNTEKILKNNYIGEYKNRWELSTDFRNYTSLAQLQALWWTWIVTDGSYSIWSFGIKQTTTNKYTRIYVNLPIKLTTNNKITIEYTGNSASNEALAGRASWQINNSTEPDWWLCAMNMFWTTWWEQWILGGQDWWIIRWWKNGSWDFSVKWTFDLSTGKVTYSQTLPSWIAYSNTVTMSNRAIQDALNFWIGAFAIQDYGSWNSICLYTASIIIE